jgi:hypothetical protein
MNAVRLQLSAHPALLPLRWASRKESREALAVLDRERTIFKSARFDEALARDVHRTLGSYLVGFVVAGTQPHPGISNTDWAAQFDVGLEILMDGIEARLRRERRSRPERPRKPR